MTETIVRAADNSHAPGPCTADGHSRETWTERDHTDQYIV